MKKSSTQKASASGAHISTRSLLRPLQAFAKKDHKELKEGPGENFLRR